MSKAIVYRELGSPDVWQLVDDWKIPDRAEGEVRVAIKSSSFNPIDATVRKGSPAFKTILPKVPGGDLAGLVVEADPNSQYKAGDPVLAFTTGAFSPYGTWTEFANVPEKLLARSPPNLNLSTEAGGLPLAALTAFQALESGNPTEGSRVLIHGGAGGVGSFAVQLAKHHWKAYVVSTSRSTDFVKSLGADEVVDYTQEDFAEKYKDRPFDVIVDSVHGETEIKSYTVLKPGATYVHIRATGRSDPKLIEEGAKWTDKKFAVTVAQPNGEQLSVIAQLIADGKVKVPVSDVIPLERVGEAEDLAKKKKFGKIVIKI